MATRRGQAMIEMALGMFALALVLSALFGYAACIVKSLDMFRPLRAKCARSAMNAYGGGVLYTISRDSVEVEVEPFAADWIFSSEKMDIGEAVAMPNMKGVVQ